MSRQCSVNGSYFMTSITEISVPL